jgi:prepilin-type N-terminal cleavage/methylation domain-containing protein
MTQGQTRTRHRERGYTLAELLAAMGIIGLTLGIAAYTMDRGGWRTDAALSEVTDQLTQARARAVFDQNDFVVTFDTTNQAFRVHDDENSNGTVEAGIGEEIRIFELRQASADVIFGYATGTTGLDGNVINKAVNFPGTPPTITFDPLGRGDGGVIYMITREDLERGKPDNMRAIQVNQATGRIRRWRYDSDRTPIPWRLAK